MATGSQLNRHALFGVLALVQAWGCSPSPERVIADAADASVTDVGSEDATTADASVDTPPDVAEACTYRPETTESIPAVDPTSRPYVPRWVFTPWISKDISDTADTYDFVDGFIARDIPVGTVVLDSPWETNYNTLIPNPERYPDFEQLVGDMRQRGVRVVLWTTQLVNENSFDAEAGGDFYDGAASNFAEGRDCGFFVNDGALYTWWKGKGGSIDFFNPLARQWWHEQQDALLEMGVAGWKLDFGDSYVLGDTVQTAAGEVTHQEYSESYYRDFYEYGLHKAGAEDFVTMVRAYDASYQFEGRFYARRGHAPVVWVGDNRRDWLGLEDALDHTFRSAAAGYVVIGSDLGGYLNRDDQMLSTQIPFDRATFMRWLAVAAMSPFMQLHGRANLTPWTLPDDPDVDESVANYRYWATLHTELVPFWYGLANDGAGDEPIIRPLGAPDTWAGDYRYMLGDAFLVAPILDSSGVREVGIPDGVFFDWWTGERVVGPTTVTADFSTDLRGIPMWVKQGAILELESSSTVTGLTPGTFAGATTLLVWPAQESAFSGDALYVVSDDGSRVIVRASAVVRPLVVRIRFDEPFSSIVAGPDPVAEVPLSELAARPGYAIDGVYVWVSLAAGAGPSEIRINR